MFLNISPKVFLYWLYIVFLLIRLNTWYLHDHFVCAVVNHKQLAFPRLLQRHTAFQTLSSVNLEVCPYSSKGTIWYPSASTLQLRYSFEYSYGFLMIIGSYCCCILMLSRDNICRISATSASYADSSNLVVPNRFYLDLCYTGMLCLIKNQQKLSLWHLADVALRSACAHNTSQSWAAHHLPAI